MGAVLLLVFLPLLVAALAFVASGTGVAGILFVLLAAFVLGSLLYQANGWDKEEDRRQPGGSASHGRATMALDPTEKPALSDEQRAA